MKAIARYPFQGNPAHAQISFPMGAELTIKSKSNKDGWVWGTYGVQKGWLPASYVEIFPESLQRPNNMHPPTYSPSQQPPPQSSRYLQSTQITPPVSPRLRSRVLDVPPGMSASVGFADRSVTSSTNTISHDDVLPPITSVSFDSRIEDSAVSVMGDNESVNVFRDSQHHITPDRTPISQSNPDTNDDFPLMGGVPGSLFDAPKMALVEETHLEHEQLPQEELEEEPVDIYRHAPAKKKLWNNRADYSPEISVQVTSKPRPSTPAMNYKTKVAPVPVTPEEFWKAHPGRTGTITSSEQRAYEVDHAFAGLDDQATIEIVAEKEKKKFHMPKGLKKTWKKAKEGVRAMH